MLKDILQTPRPITPLTPDTIFSVAGFPIANTTLMVLFIALLIFILGYFVFRKFTLAPHTKFQIAVEMLYEMVIGLISQLTGGKERAQAIFPIIGAMLVYLTFANLLASFPILGEITYSGKQFLRGATADFNTTLGLAFASVVAINIISIREWGFFGWIGKFFKFKEVYLGFKKGLAQGGIACIDFFVGMLDIIGEAAKVISLALRLFGNMYAGVVLMGIILGAFAYVIPTVWLVMSLFVGVLQAMVFSSLVVAYYMLAINEDKTPKLQEETANLFE